MGSISEGSVLSQWGKELMAGQGAGVWLWPYLYLGRLPFVTDLLSWLPRLGASVAVWGVGYLLVLRYGVGFEERELAGAKARASALSAARRGRLGANSEKPVRPAWINLGAKGALWRAIAWKNFTSLTRHVPWGLVVFLFFFIVQLMLIFSVTSGQGRLPLKIGGLSLALGIFFALFGSQFIKEDLRADLSNIELIKALPMASRQLVRGEIYGAASVVILGVFGFLLMFVMLFLSSADVRPNWLPIVIGAASLFVVLSVASLVTFFVDNALVLLFPAWILPLERADTRHGGVDQLGRSVINMFLKIVALLLFSLLPGFFSGITWFLAVRFKIMWLLPVGASLFAAVMIIQLELGIMWLAGLFERLDPSYEGI